MGDNIKMISVKLCVTMWTGYLAQDRDLWQASVNTINELYNVGNCPTS